MNKKKTVSPDLRGTPAFERMRQFLGSYGKCRNVCETYKEEKMNGTINESEKSVRDAFFAECECRCSEIEKFINGLCCRNDEKMLLWLHYVEGKSIEAASERLYVSRSTAFRISKRAEEYALLAFMTYESGQHAKIRDVS